MTINAYIRIRIRIRSVNVQIVTINSYIRIRIRTISQQEDGRVLYITAASNRAVLPYHQTINERLYAQDNKLQKFGKFHGQKEIPKYSHNARCHVPVNKHGQLLDVIATVNKR